MNTDTACRVLPCDQSVAERPRYYPRQLITSDDLTLEQDYFRSRLRMHNRMLHGWGVVCGADICYVLKENTQEAEPWMVMVTPGYVLGPYGDDIYLDCKRRVDLRGRGVIGVTGETCADEPDVWCSEVFDSREEQKLFIAVKYKQVAMRPVRVQPAGCGCDDSRCENSRWRDGYEIGVLTECPDPEAQAPTFADLFTGQTPDCAPCPEQPWVVLGSVTVDADGKVTAVVTCECRRLAASFMNFWWPCELTEKTSPAGVTELTEDDKRNLEKFAQEIQANASMTGYILGYGMFEKEGLDKANKARDFVVGKFGIPAARLKTIDGGCRKQATLEFAVLPDTAPAPTKRDDADTIPCQPRSKLRTLETDVTGPPPAVQPASPQPAAGGRVSPVKRPKKKPGKRNVP